MQVLSSCQPRRSLDCFYDVTTHALVGARFATDVNDFCQRTSSTKSSGRLADSSCQSTPMLGQHDCTRDGAAP